MKSLLLVTTLLITSHAFASWKSESRAIIREYQTECRNTEVSVDEIVRNSHIKGHVSGLPTDAYDQFKVVVYVKTNRWYVHPYTHYEGQEEGYSYANINENGEFKIRTVLRNVPAKQMVVAVVPRPYQIKSQKFWLHPLFGFFGGVLKYKCSHTMVQGNGDFFM